MGAHDRRVQPAPQPGLVARLTLAARLSFDGAYPDDSFDGVNADESLTLDELVAGKREAPAAESSDELYAAIAWASDQYVPRVAEAAAPAPKRARAGPKR